MKTSFVQQVTPRAVSPQALRRGKLSRVWIESGNSKKPLVAVWIDEAMRAPEPASPSDAIDRGASLLCA